MILWLAYLLGSIGLGEVLTVVQWEQTRPVFMMTRVRSPGLAQWGSSLLWLWHRLAAAAPPIRLLAWEYAIGVALKKKKKKKRKKEKKTTTTKNRPGGQGGK